MRPFGKLRIFLSSTHKDLKPERLAVIGAVELLEKFALVFSERDGPSSESSALEWSQKQARNCDAMVLLVGRTRGSLPNVPFQDCRTFVHQELAEAVTAGRPIFKYRVKNYGEGYAPIVMDMRPDKFNTARNPQENNDAPFEDVWPSPTYDFEAGTQFSARIAFERLVHSTYVNVWRRVIVDQSDIGSIVQHDLECTRWISKIVRTFPRAGMRRAMWGFLGRKFRQRTPEFPGSPPYPRDEGYFEHKLALAMQRMYEGQKGNEAETHE